MKNHLKKKKAKELQQRMDKMKRIQEGLRAENAQRHQKSFSLFSNKNIPTKPINYEYANPFSWKKFNIFGETFERVPFPVRFTLFAVTFLFRLAWWPISTISRFYARGVAKYEFRADRKQRILKEMKKHKLPFKRIKAGRVVKKEEAKAAAYRKSAEYLEGTEPRRHMELREQHNLDIEENDTLSAVNGWVSSDVSWPKKMLA